MPEMKSKYTMFCIELPPLNHLTDLAPRVRGTGDHVGEYGYALLLDQYGQVEVLWDDGGRELVPVESLVFLNNGGTE